MNVLIRNGRVIDPASGRDETADVAIAAGRILSIGQVPADFTPDRTIEADGCVVAPGLVDMLKFRARKISRCRLFPLGALTRGLEGEELTEMVDLTEAGCVGFSQAEHAVKDNLTLMRAMQYASTSGYAVWLRPQERSLSGGEIGRAHV